MQLEHLKNLGMAVFPSGNNVLTELSCQSGSSRATRGQISLRIQPVLWEDMDYIMLPKIFDFVLDESMKGNVHKTFEMTVMTGRKTQQKLLDGAEQRAAVVKLVPNMQKYPAAHCALGFFFLGG